jgi:hypothetical protein
MKLKLKYCLLSFVLWVLYALFILLGGGYNSY